MWIDAIRQIIENPPICAIVGNKCNFTILQFFSGTLQEFLGDLEHQRAVRLDKTKHFVQDYRLFNFLVSAKTGEAVSITKTLIKK